MSIHLSDLGVYYLAKPLTFFLFFLSHVYSNDHLIQMTTYHGFSHFVLTANNQSTILI